MAKSLAITACRGNGERTSPWAMEHVTTDTAQQPNCQQAQTGQICGFNLRPEKKNKKNTTFKQTKTHEYRALTGYLELPRSFPMWSNETKLLSGHHSWCNFSKCTFPREQPPYQELCAWLCICFSSMRRILKAYSHDFTWLCIMLAGKGGIWISHLL